ncbi:uncharacterized protein LOC106655857 [Trichogramma pretiosum]|uniref:uncharacterized protein LOC106655857 n=1 Tax=Trichogramma pretiosum TaxID=7493 RepID=UPI0006C97375|nr:uncharacterized protein LOC106655857 [Trichogramma pretiosum]
MRKSSFLLIACIWLSALATSFLPCDAAPSPKYLSSGASEPHHNRHGGEHYWHKPCGIHLNDISIGARASKSEVRSSMMSVRIQFQLVFNDFQKQNYDYLYDDASNDLKEKHYVPNWLPWNTSWIKDLTKARFKGIADLMPMLHSDLQKFAMALEMVHGDEQRRKKVKDALFSTKNYLKSLLCEVETSIASMQAKIPDPIGREIMTSEDRKHLDETNRIVRDWGILLKYKNYLFAWEHVFEKPIQNYDDEDDD